MYYLHIFDPWNFPLCTCPKKYSVDPYTGCEHRCIYCYITSYIREPWRVRPKRDFLKLFERDLKRASIKLPISMSNSSDPYPTMERDLRITRGALNLMKRYDFPVLVLTKSDLVMRDYDILSTMRSVVSITLTTLDEHLSKKLEPFAPSPYRRLKAVEFLKSKGLKVAVRIDPLIPTINDSEINIKNLVEELASLEIDQIIASVYKAKRDNFRRVIGVFKDKKEVLKKMYFEDGEVIRGIIYAPRRIRENILGMVRREAIKHGIPFSVCREGLDINTARTCDASHLL